MAQRQADLLRVGLSSEHEQHGVDPEIEPAPPAGQMKKETAGICTQVCLAVAVVITGSANNISKQVAAKPLSRYSYMLGLATAVAYLPLFGAVLWALMWTGAVPRSQLQFVWRKSPGRRFPYLIYFAVAALGDTLGDLIGIICTPYVAGPLVSLLANCTTLFIALLSMIVLFKRYSLMQCLALLGVLTGVVLGLIPSFEGGAAAKTTVPAFAIAMGLSCIFNAVSFVTKELLFTEYKTWQQENEGAESSGNGLHVFVVNTHAALFQLPLTLLLIPLNQAAGQTNGESIFAYAHEAFVCVFTSGPSSCGASSVHEELAGTTVLIYVFFNICWNIFILTSVKVSGALATFVALKAIFPVSAVLFAFVDWPLLGKTPLNWLIWVSMCLVVPCIFLYQYASKAQNRRAQQQPSTATCCWPFGARIAAPSQ